MIPLYDWDQGGPCSLDFWTYPLGPDRHYDEDQLATMPYTLYLQTDDWKETRIRALLRANHTCERCGSRQKLHVHHLTYERRGAEHLDDLLVLCADCHRAEHGIPA